MKLSDYLVSALSRARTDTTDSGTHHPVCIGCGKRPEEIEEYVEAARDEDTTPDAYVRTEEGTFNRENGHFACTDCYIAMGMPSLPYPRSWVAP